MPVWPQPARAVPGYWTIFGHSYFQMAFGTRTQAGRADAVFRGLLDCELNNFVNHATSGSRLTFDGAAQGGWVKIARNTLGMPNSTFSIGPYIANVGGAFLLGYGINDIGINGNTVQFNTAYQMAMRFAISRLRASTVRRSDYAFSGGNIGTVTYGSGFTTSSFTNDISSGPTFRTATTTGANATVTITIPADYQGEVLTVCFVAEPGVKGGTVTFSGTAGVTGSFSTSNWLPATSRFPVVQRITNLTSAAAGQTIIMTVTALDASGAVNYDSYWLESKSPPPVIVCNTARLTTAGYAANYAATGIGDADVVTFNGYLTALMPEFDAMVQIADIDSAINKDAIALAFDGLHPSEWGAARIADAIIAAIIRLVPNSPYGPTANLQPPAPARAPLYRPRISGQWYTSDCFGAATGGTAYTAVAGDVWAVPIYVTGGIEAWSQWSVELIASTVATTVLFAVYDDRTYAGYPQHIHIAPANVAGTPFSLATGAGAKLSPTSAGNGFLTQAVDPGLYWLVMKVITAGTTTFRSLKGPSMWLPNLTTGGAGGVSPCAWFLAGQGAGALPNLFTTGATAADLAPMIGLKMQ